MRFLFRGKDGGPASTVTGYWLAEIKSLFSIALLRFDHGTREAFHSHAFDSVSWLLRGSLHEDHVAGVTSAEYGPSWLPIVTRRTTFHRVRSRGTSWVLTFRGPWSKRWSEWDPVTSTISILEIGRRVVWQTPTIVHRAEVLP